MTNKTSDPKIFQSYFSFNGGLKPYIQVSEPIC